MLQWYTASHPRDTRDTARKPAQATAHGRQPHGPPPAAKPGIPIRMRSQLELQVQLYAAVSCEECALRHWLDYGLVSARPWRRLNQHSSHDA